MQKHPVPGGQRYLAEWWWCVGKGLITALRHDTGAEGPYTGTRAAAHADLCPQTRGLATTTAGIHGAQPCLHMLGSLMVLEAQGAETSGGSAWTSESVAKGMHSLWEALVFSSTYRKGDCVFWRIQRGVDCGFSPLGQRSGCRPFPLL